MELILARHGQSEANAADVFTGWSDPPLTARGRAEADAIAARLQAAGLSPRRIFTSCLDRAMESSTIVAARLAIPKADIVRAEALNERDYGDLTGLNKAEVTARWGKAQINTWRRSYDVAPPGGEALRDTAARVLAHYVHAVLPSLLCENCVLVVAHGNSLRALVMALEGLSVREIETVEIPTGTALVYTLAPNTTVTSKAVLT
jgi:2,3-bisphosphoglycerate-dependent phosphoglycerate mutase